MGSQSQEGTPKWISINTFNSQTRQVVLVAQD